VPSALTDESWDTLHDPGDEDAHWSTDNVGEAAPGVLTPFSWSMWGPTGDGMPRRIAYSMGVFSRDDLAHFPLIVRPFYGRIAMRMEYLAAVGDRMPGAGGADIVLNMFGRIPETMTFDRTKRRWPVIAYKLPHSMLTAPRGVRAAAPQIDAWWRSQVVGVGSASLADAAVVLRHAVAEFDRMLTVHSLALLSVVQPLLVELTKLVEQAGIGDVGALSGSGGAEMAIVTDIWNASRGIGTVADVVANHGFHGPLEGEASSRVWREDPAPLERMVDAYRNVGESDSPVARERTSAARLPELQREVLAAVPRARRPQTRLLLNLAARTIPLRGVGKRSFLQSLDVARAAGRRIGTLLADSGELADPDDVFYLTVQELYGPLPGNARELVELRRARRAAYEAIDLPGNWHRTPEVTSRPAAGDVDGVDGADGDDGAPDAVLTGTGASAGVVEGVVRVVLDPTFAEVEPDEILVTPTTDPSWASIMFISAGLVVDIGGMLSHAAVVARELGIPCVVNTRVGSRTLRTGDRVRIDGSAGTVEILSRAAPVSR
jgi:pyruvate,water dikinase